MRAPIDHPLCPWLSRTGTSLSWLRRSLGAGGRPVLSSLIRRSLRSPRSRRLQNRTAAEAVNPRGGSAHTESGRGLRESDLLYGKERCVRERMCGCLCACVHSNYTDGTVKLKVESAWGKNKKSSVMWGPHANERFGNKKRLSPTSLRKGKNDGSTAH